MGDACSRLSGAGNSIPSTANVPSADASDDARSYPSADPGKALRTGLHSDAATMIQIAFRAMRTRRTMAQRRRDRIVKELMHNLDGKLIVCLLGSGFPGVVQK